jgi:hypothetical protein
MTAVARMALLDLRTVTPYRYQGFLLLTLYVALFVTRPTVLVPALVMLVAVTVAAYPFNVADKASLGTLYCVLPLPRRAVVIGHYAWAVATFLAAAVIGTPLALVFAHVRGIPFGTHVIATELTLSWAMFAAVVAIQFPLFIRYGYTRTSALATGLPLATILGLTYKFHLDTGSIQAWLPFVAAAATTAIVTSAAAAIRIYRTAP